MKRVLRQLGVDIVRARHIPTVTFAGQALRDIHTVVDVGANRGQFARYARRLFPTARIYCFEPLAAPFAELSAWARELNDGQVIPVCAAIGQRDGTSQIFVHDDHDESSSILPSTSRLGEMYPFTRKQSSVVVPMMRLDTWVSGFEGQLDRQVLLKLDVQGYELQALEGAASMLEFVDLCVVEISVARLYEGQASFSGVAGILESSGLRYAGNLKQNYDSVGRVVFLDAVFARD